MSFLTKLLALLVSLLSIFLCGAVVVFVTNTNNWKKAYQDQETLTRAAQTYALEREMDLKDQKQRDSGAQQRLNELVVTWQSEYIKLENDLKQQAAARITAEGKAASAVKVSDALAALVNNMRQTRNALQQRLEVAHNDIRRILQCGDDAPANLLSHCHLCRVGEQTLALVAQRQPRVDHDLAVLDLYDAAKSAYPKRLRTQYADEHVPLSSSSPSRCSE